MQSQRGLSAKNRNRTVAQAIPVKVSKKAASGGYLA
jgi:hypothetical protein